MSKVSEIVKMASKTVPATYVGKLIARGYTTAEEKKFFIPGARSGFSFARDRDSLKGITNFRGDDPMEEAYRPMQAAAAKAVYDPLLHTYEGQLIANSVKDTLASYFRHLGISSVERKNVTTGAGVAALFPLALEAFEKKGILRKGDAILMPVPTYGIIPQSMRGLGTDTIYPLKLQAENGYKLTPEMLHKHITGINAELVRTHTDKVTEPPRVKVFVMINPHNPTSNVYGEETARAIGDVLKEQKVWAIDDFTYHTTEYPGIHRAVPLASSMGMEQCLTFIGLSKPFSGVQLRGGATCGPEDMIKLMSDIHFFRQGSTGVSMPSEVAPIVQTV